MKRTKKFAWETASARETGRWGEAMGAAITSGICVSLVGPLGAGKTVLVGGVCRGLGVDEDVLSPTFVLYEEFSGRLPVVHVDLYRLEHDVEIEELGVFDAIGGGKVILAEWGDRSETLLAASDAVIEITPASADGRAIEVQCTPEVAGVFEELQTW
jgi:tRNA threonylcarbamoyladenosine biosynthesis protein TsaE